MVTKKMLSLNYAFVPLHQTIVTEFLQRDPQTNSGYEFLELTLEDIYVFDQRACAVEAKYPTKRIVVHTYSNECAQATMAFLMGCHMILSHGLGFEETHLSFRRLHSILDPQVPGWTPRSRIQDLCGFMVLCQRRPQVRVDGRHDTRRAADKRNCTRAQCNGDRHQLPARLLPREMLRVDHVQGPCGGIA